MGYRLCEACPCENREQGTVIDSGKELDSCFHRNDEPIRRSVWCGFS